MSISFEALKQEGFDESATIQAACRLFKAAKTKE